MLIHIKTAFLGAGFVLAMAAANPYRMVIDKEHGKITGFYGVGERFAYSCNRDGDDEGENFNSTLTGQIPEFMEYYWPYWYRASFGMNEVIKIPVGSDSPLNTCDEAVHRLYGQPVMGYFQPPLSAKLNCFVSTKINEGQVYDAEQHRYHLPPRNVRIERLERCLKAYS